MQRKNRCRRPAAARVERSEIDKEVKSEATVTPDDVLKFTKDMVTKHGDNVTIIVVQKLMQVFSPHQGFFDMLALHGGPDRVVDA